MASVDLWIVSCPGNQNSADALSRVFGVTEDMARHWEQTVPMCAAEGLRKEEAVKYVRALRKRGFKVQCRVHDPQVPRARQSMGPRLRANAPVEKGGLPVPMNGRRTRASVTSIYSGAGRAGLMLAAGTGALLVSLNVGGSAFKGDADLIAVALEAFGLYAVVRSALQLNKILRHRRPPEVHWVWMAVIAIALFATDWLVGGGWKIFEPLLEG